MDSTYSSNGQRELAHGVESARAPVDELLDEGGKGSTSGPLGAQATDLFLGGDFTSKEKPEETFGQWFLATGCLRKGLLDVGDGVTTEADTLFGIKDGA